MKVISPAVALAVATSFAVSAIGHADAADCAYAEGVVGNEVPQIASGQESGALARSTAACESNEVSYLKSITVLKKTKSEPQPDTDMTKVGVKFFRGGDEITGLAKDDCTNGVKYTNVGMTAGSSGDVTAKITCADTANPCDVTYAAEWACYTPYFSTSLDKTLKRKTATGASCTSASDECVNRCAKSLKITTDTTGATATLTSAFTPGTCQCQDLTATVKTDGISAENDDKTVQVTVDGATITVKSETCESTYEEGTLTNPFSAKTYTRGTVTPDDCIKTDCTYKCAAELVSTVPSADDVVATPATVTGCTCTAIKAVVSDDQTKATATTGDSSATTFELTTTANGITIKTTTGETTCTAPYTVKATSTGSSSGTSSNSGTGSSSGSNKNTTAPTPTPTPTSGVSMNTIWAVAATAVIAVAGAFVMV